MDLPFRFQTHVPIVSGGTTVCHIPPSARPREQWGAITRFQTFLVAQSSPSAPAPVPTDRFQESRGSGSSRNDDDDMTNTSTQSTSISTTRSRKEVILTASPPVMIRQRLRMRQEEGVQKEEVIVPWYNCRTPSRLSAPPRGDHFPGIQSGDLFVHWIANTRQCQVWMATAVDDANIQWEPARWGQPLHQGRHLIIRSMEGKPSAVEKSTWEKTYRRKVSPIVD
ncbi:hypothetical protein BDN72DRAFT_845051, partial [Pluteus cervinus]